ncbi:MAG: IgGFc-binding protein [Byssovorax sp.]
MRYSRPLILGSAAILGLVASCGGGGTGGTTSGSTSATTTSSGQGGAGGQGGSGATGGSTSSSGGGGQGGETSGTGGTGGAPCAAGTVYCDGDFKKTCDGNGGVTTEDCMATGQVCVPVLGCLNCVPGTGTCAGDVGTYCLPDGSGYGKETCNPAQGTNCNPQTGSCDGACSPKALGKSYIGCDYFPTVTANLVGTQFHFAVAVSNTTGNAATVTITQGAAQITQVAVAANSVQVITLPWQDTLKGPASLSVIPFPSSVKVAQGAYRLQSTQPVTVYQFNPLEYTTGGDCLSDFNACSFSNDASLLLPTNAWTGTYRVAARHHFYSTSGFYAVTAKEDNTTVTVTPGPQSGSVKGGIPGIGANGAGQVTLNAGDVIEVVDAGDDGNGSDPNDVTGTLVAASKPVQVIGGHQCVYIPDNVGYCDHLEESMFPYETLANDYIVTAPLIPTGGNVPKVEMVRVVATQDATTLTYDPPQGGAPGSIATAGGWIEIPNNAGDFQISADKPILVVQYMEGQDAGGNSGDPAMATAVAKSQYRTNYLFHAPTNYETSYVNIVAPTGEAVLLDGANVNGFSPIGNTGFSIARTSISNAGDGNHNASSAKAFGISVYGYGQYTSYWYPGGSDLTVLHE